MTPYTPEQARGLQCVKDKMHALANSVTGIVGFLELGDAAKAHLIAAQLVERAHALEAAIGCLKDTD